MQLRYKNNLVAVIQHVKHVIQKIILIVFLVVIRVLQ